MCAFQVISVIQYVTYCTFYENRKKNTEPLDGRNLVGNSNQGLAACKAKPDWDTI